MPTRAQVQAAAKKKAAAKNKAAPKKAAPKKPVRGQRAATSAATQKKTTPKKPSNRMVVKPKKNSTRTPKVVAKPLQGKDLGGAKQAKMQQAKATPKTPLRGKDLGGAKQAKMQQAKSGASVKPAATAAGRKTQIAKLLKLGLKRAGLIGLGFTIADFAGLLPEFTDRDARMGRRAQEAQKKEKAIKPKDKGLEKKANPPRKKPVNIGNVSKAKADAAARKKEREDAMAERLAAKRAERKAAMAKKKVPANVVRDGTGKPVRTKNKGYLTSGGFDENKNFWE